VHVIKLQPGDTVAAVARISAADLKKAGASNDDNEKSPKEQPILL